MKLEEYISSLIQEGIIGGAFQAAKSVAATPFKAVSQTVKTIPRAVGAVGSVANQGVRAVGNVATGNIAGAGANLAQAGGKVGGIVTKPVKSLVANPLQKTAQAMAR